MLSCVFYRIWNEYFKKSKIKSNWLIEKWNIIKSARPFPADRRQRPRQDVRGERAERARQERLQGDRGLLRRDALLRLDHGEDEDEGEIGRRL